MSMWDDEAGYTYDDPKHPSFYERSVEAWDNRDKSLDFMRRKREATERLLRDIENADPGDETDAA